MKAWTSDEAASDVSDCRITLSYIVVAVIVLIVIV